MSVESIPDTAEPIIAPGQTYASVSDKISAIVLTRKTPLGWWVGFGIAFLLMMILFLAIAYVVNTGVGIWGVNIPVAWAYAITNFVWWIGIGHAGTLISAILLLLHQEWRTSINRFAEAMTLFAVACAGLFPLLHLGRQWIFYWLFPYPNTMTVQPQFRSPLVWDVFAVSTYFTVSLIFWYTGLIPDMGTLRDRARSRSAKVIYGVLSWGWRGSARHWHRYQTAYLLLAGLATPLVVSVHTVVSFDFSVAILPGWHSAFFPPYFVAGAIFSGFAMVLTLAIPIRAFYGLEEFVTMRHLRYMANVMLATGLIVAYAYVMETFMSWYSGDIFEKYQAMNRMFGPYAPLFWLLILFNVVIPQLIWIGKIKTNTLALWLIAMGVNIGMWIERFVIIVVGLHRDFLPSSWAMYRPTIWDWATLFGSVGLFLTLQFLFIRLLPMISISELRHLVHKTEESTAS